MDDGDNLAARHYDDPGYLYDEDAACIAHKFGGWWCTSDNASARLCLRGEPEREYASERQASSLCEDA